MKIIKRIIIIMLLTSCGFSPIYSKKNIDFQINKIEFEGDKEIRAILLSNLNTYKTTKKNVNNYDLKIKAEKNIEVVTKNKKGEATLYKLNINSIIDIFSNNKLLLTKNYSNSSTYSSEKKIIKLKEVEYRNLLNLSTKLTNEIILTLSLTKNKSDF